MRKFNKNEIDTLFELIKSDEEILWKSKPNLIPDYTFVTTLLLLLGACIGFIVLSMKNPNIDQWFTYSIAVIGVGIFGYGLFYTYRYFKKINSLVYIITNYRLAIIDMKTKRFIISKRYNLIKILKVKQTVFNTASIIFDIDYHDDRMIEIGFINVNQADKVLAIIHQQVSHVKNLSE